MTDATPTADAPNEAAESAAERRHNIAELIAAILLGVAGVLTAFSAYQAALTDGDALEGYTESTQLLANSNQFYAQAVQQNTSDRDLFTQFAIASTSGNLDVADYIAATLMDDNLRGAVEWWVGASETDDAALSPFAEHPDNPYVNTNQAEAVALEEQSVAKQAEGSKADEDGDQFELAAVLFALTLFFGGIATLLHRALATWILLGAAAVSSVVGVIVLVPVL